jgi:hypothetical protein
VNFPNPNLSSWTALGPAPLTANGNASGRITGIAVDPTDSTHIYVAAAGGGVWQTTDGGTTYTPLTDTQASLAMGAIAIAPSNRLKIYAGTGEANNSADSNFGAGILVSNDGGTSWSLSTGPGSVFARRAIAKISVHPTDPNTAYAAVNDFAENGLCCSGTGIYKTADGGVTWTNVTSASFDSLFPWSDVVVDPNNPSIVYAAHGDIFADNTANGVYRSLNGGSTWALLGNAPSGNGIGRIALAVAPSASTSGNHVLYVAIATPLGNSSVLYEMLSSSNADAATPTFTNLTSTPNFGGSGGQAWYDWVIGVDPANALNVYAAGALDNNTHHVIRSTNGGASWTDITIVNGIQPHTDSHAMAFDSASRLLLGNDGGINRFDPTVPSWTNLNTSLNTIQFTGIGLHPTSTQTVLGGSQDNGTELTTGSLNWTATDNGDGGYTLFSQQNASLAYGNHPIGSFGPTAFFRVSTNGGVNWTARTPIITNSNQFNFYAPIAVDSSNGNRVFLGGDGLYESINAAVSWTKHSSPSTNPIDAIAVLPGGNTIYLATGGTFATSSQVWISTNDGSTWTAINLPSGSGRVQEIDVDPNDTTGNTAVAVVNTFNAASQIYRSTNGGSSWTSINGNLPLVPTWSAKIDTDTNKTIYVSNETAVYSSPSPYSTWTTYGTGLPHAQGVQLQFNSSLHELAVATHGRGAWNISTPNPPTVVSYSVICGTGCTYNMVGNSRTHLPWQITGVKVVFSQTITSANTGSLTGVTATGISGVGTNTVTWTFAGVTNGNLATALATSGLNAIQSAGGTLTGSNTSFALKILQGDMSDDGVVNASDLTLVNNARTAAYNIFADINGDGVVDINDVTIVRSKIGQTNP